MQKDNNEEKTTEHGNASKENSYSLTVEVFTMRKLTTPLRGTLREKKNRRVFKEENNPSAK